MVDPFFIIAGAAGLVEVCVCLTTFLKQAKDGFQRVDQDLEQLSAEIEALRSVSDLVESKFKDDIAVKRGSIDQQVVNDQWQATQKALEGCAVVLQKLRVLMTGVLGREQSSYAKFKSLKNS